MYSHTNAAVNMLYASPANWPAKDAIRQPPYNRRGMEQRNELGAVLRDGMPARIKALRNARGLSQDELAEACGVTRGAVAQWESGLVRNIRLLTFMKLCEALGTDPQYLIYGPDRSPPKKR